MMPLPSFHDGFLDGLWMAPEKKAHLFLRTASGERHTVILSGVEALVICNFKQGNIILDMVLVKSDEITTAHVQRLYEFATGDRAAPKLQSLLDSIRERGLIVVEINPSYGADCLILCQTAELQPTRSILVS
jgi:hypothetical protein